MPLFASLIGIISKVTEEDGYPLLFVQYNGDTPERKFVAEVKIYTKNFDKVNQPVYVAGTAVFKQGILRINSEVCSIINDNNVPISSPCLVCDGMMESPKSIGVEQYFNGETVKFSLAATVRPTLKIGKYLKQGSKIFATLKFRGGSLEIQQVHLAKSNPGTVSASELLQRGELEEISIVPNFVSEVKNEANFEDAIANDDEAGPSNKRRKGKK
jgi:hypothetical protein